MARKSRRNPPDIVHQIVQITWYCGSYCRLSDDDHTGKVSNSIENQSVLTRSYIDNLQNAVFTAEFADDGKSGTTFSRKGFETMIKEIMAGRINCVVVKDLSRLGRNYIDTEDYITKVFPFLGVRFIAVNDEIDTMAPDFDEKILQMRIKNLTNDLYAKQVSQSVGQAFEKMGEEGIYHGPVPPYGYLIDPCNTEKRRLVIEKEAVEIPRMIFSHYLSGDSLYSITKYLNDHQIAPPMRHFSDLGLYRSARHSGETKWYKSTVKSILENPAYCGCLAKKRHKCSLYKGIPLHKIPKEEWELVLHTHEAIISMAEYETVQNMLELKKSESRKRAAAAVSTRKTNLFAGKMRCGCCGKPLKRDYFMNRGEGRTYYQCCEGYKYKSTTAECKNCYINEDKLEAILSELLEKYAVLFLETTEITGALLLNTGIKQKVDTLKRALSELEKNSYQILNKKKEVYSDLKREIIGQDEYLFLKAQYEIELKHVKEQMTEKKEELIRLESKLDSICKWQDCFQKYSNESQLSKDMVESFISRIVVHSSSQIEVEFHFRDVFDNHYMQTGNQEAV